MSDVTRLIEAAAAGDRKAAAELLPIVYDELRSLAAARMAAENSGHTLNPTALVHEAYLRLVGPADGLRWDNRGHFLAAAAVAMRHILVDHARAKRADKRGGDKRVECDFDRLAQPERDGYLEALDEALSRLAVAQPQVAELVQLRYFVGLSIPDAAEILGISPRTADAWWAYARGWLAEDLKKP